MQANKELDASVPVSQAATYSASKVRKLKCMFTTQVTKKRKAWSDGLLKVFFSGGTYQCSLIDCSKIRETSLVSRQLEAVEVQKLKKNEEIELEFEGYLVTVLAGNDYDETKVGPPLKLPKFVPPSVYVPVNRAPAVLPVQRVASVSTGPYQVSTAELDDLWDREAPAAGVTITRHNTMSNNIESTARDAGRGVVDNRPSQYPQRMQHAPDNMEHFSAPYQQHHHQQQQLSHAQQRRPQQPANHDGSQRSIDKFFPSTNASTGRASAAMESTDQRDFHAPSSSHNAQRSGYGTYSGNPRAGPAGSNVGAPSAPTMKNVHGSSSQHANENQARYRPAPAPENVPQARPSHAAPTHAVPQHRSSGTTAGGAENQLRGNGVVYNNTSTAAQAKQEHHDHSAGAAPVQNAAAAYQPAGYSTIIGNSVWDSD